MAEEIIYVYLSQPSGRHDDEEEEGKVEEEEEN